MIASARTSLGIPTITSASELTPINASEGTVAGRISNSDVAVSWSIRNRLGVAAARSCPIAALT